MAQVPDRHEPNTSGEINYRYVFSLLEQLGYNGWIGLEYKPAGSTEAGLKWIDEFSMVLWVWSIQYKLCIKMKEFLSNTTDVYYILYSVNMLWPNMVTFGQTHKKDCMQYMHAHPCIHTHTQTHSRIYSCNKSLGVFCNQNCWLHHFDHFLSLQISQLCCSRVQRKLNTCSFINTWQKTRILCKCGKVQSVRMTVSTNQNCHHKEIKLILDLGNAWIHFIQNKLSSFLVSKTIEIKI